MARKKKNATTRAVTAAPAQPTSVQQVPQSKVTKAVAPKPKQPSTGKISVPATLAEGISMVGALAKHKKKKHKKGLLGSLGSFLDGAVSKAIGIVPGLLHSLAQNVHDGWVQGSYNKAMLMQRARQIPPAPFPQGMIRSDPSLNRVQVSSRVAKAQPGIVDALNARGFSAMLVPSALSAPVTYGGSQHYSFKTGEANHHKFGSGLRITGCDYLDDVVAGGLGRGTIIAQLDLNPARWDGARIAKYAAMYERFIVNSISVFYTPACPTSTQGSLIGWFDYDPTDVTGSSRDTVVKAMGSVGQDNGPVWAAHAAHFRRDPEQPDYYVDPDGSDDRLTSAGTYYLTAMTQLDSTISVFGSLSIVYDISFFIPSVQQLLPGPGPVSAWIGGGTFTVANPLGTGAVTDNDNTMELLRISTSTSTWYGFQGTKTVPSRYLFLFRVQVTSGLTAITRTLTNLTSVTLQTAMDGTNGIQFGIFDCNPDPGVDPTTVTFQIAITSTSIPLNSDIKFIRIPSGISLQQLSLQGFEKMALDTAGDVKAMKDELENLKMMLSPTVTPGVPRAVPCTSLGVASGVASPPPLGGDESSTIRSATVLMDLLRDRKINPAELKSLIEILS